MRIWISRSEAGCACTAGYMWHGCGFLWFMGSIDTTVVVSFSKQTQKLQSLNKVKMVVVAKLEKYCGFKCFPKLGQQGDGSKVKRSIDMANSNLLLILTWLLMTLINNDCERQKLKQLLKALTQFDLLSDVAANIFDLLYCMKSKLILFTFLVHITGLIAND